MILSDVTICEYVASHRMIENFSPEQVNPASYDLRIGPDIMWEDPHNLQPGALIPHKMDEEGWEVDPGEFVLAHSVESFNLPENVCAFVKLKSSRAREGWEHLMAGWCDPGWYGSVLTLELKNMSQYRRLHLRPGMLMVQMIFMFVDRPVSQLYKGSYNNDKTVKGSVHEQA